MHPRGAFGLFTIDSNPILRQTRAVALRLDLRRLRHWPILDDTGCAMDFSPLPTSSELPGVNPLPVPLHVPQPGALLVSDATALVDVLRQAIAAGTRSTDSILRAAADAARVLSVADGAAIALRTNGVILCRARSGEIAPALGSALSADSGISGECLRTATTLVCNDAATDPRVDPAVCLTLGVRSIVVVPLRAATGIVGILEAFSTRANAFGHESIDSLRALAEIAETAYDREFQVPGSPSAPVVPAASATALFTRSSVTEQIHVGKFSDEYSPRRSFWFPIVVVTALLLISMVVWWTWREPIETAANSTARSVNSPETTAAPPASRVTPLKPEAGVAGRPSERSRTRTKDVLQNAAEIEPATGDTHLSGSAADLSNSVPTAKAPFRSVPGPASEPPPNVEVAPSSSPDELAGLNSAPPALPTFGANVSTGVTEANLVHKVDPIYPQDARIQRLAGSVVLDATIAEDGSVHELKVVSGPPPLAPAAATAVRQWRYSPSLLNGKPIAVQKRITIVFKLP